MLHTSMQEMLAHVGISTEKVDSLIQTQMEKRDEGYTPNDSCDGCWDDCEKCEHWDDDIHDE